MQVAHKKMQVAHKKMQVAHKSFRFSSIVSSDRSLLHLGRPTVKDIPRIVNAVPCLLFIERPLTMFVIHNWHKFFAHHCDIAFVSESYAS